MTSMTLIHVAVLVAPFSSSTPHSHSGTSIFTATLIPNGPIHYLLSFELELEPSRAPEGIAYQLPIIEVSLIYLPTAQLLKHSSSRQCARQSQTMEAADIAVLDLMSRGTKEQEDRGSHQDNMVDRCHLDESCMKTWLDFCS